MRKAIHIGVTIGDPSGIGPEVVVKSLQQLRIPSPVKLFVFGDKDVLYANGFKHAKSCVEIIDHALIKLPELKFGVLSKKYGYASFSYLQSAVRYLREGIIDCLVTAPINKKAISLNRVSFRGHTEFLAQQFGVKRFAMLFIAKQLRMSVVTRHIALARVSALLTKKKIIQTIEMTHEAVRNDFNIHHPRIAVLGLNPHASDGGIIGSEERKIIEPAITSAQKKIRNTGSLCGPLSPDTVFHRVVKNEFDAVVCMYHDQALIPFKLLHFYDGVNLTAGLPFVRTSCDHGTAFEIAGRNKADFHSMREAIKLAYLLTKNRLRR